MKQQYFKVVAISLILLLFGAGIVVARQSNDSENVIMAAYNKNTGALRIVWDGNLRPNEVPLSWNIRGPQGDDGTCSCPITLENYDNLLSRISSLEEALSLISDPGGDFVATTEMLDYEDINLDVLSDFTYLMSATLSKVSLDYDNTEAKLWITSKEVGFESIWLSNYPSSGISEEDREIAVIEVDVKEDGSMDMEILPWTEGAFRNFSKSDLNLPDIDKIEFFPPGVVMVDELTLDLLGFSVVFARSAGETTIVFTSNEGHEANIEIEVDDNRNITEFQITAADFIAPDPEPVPDLFISFSVVNWDEPHDIYFPGSYNSWDLDTAPTLSEYLILAGESIIQELELDNEIVEFSILSERDWNEKWSLDLFNLTNMKFNDNGDLKITYPQNLRGGIYVEVDVYNKTISAEHDIAVECFEGAQVSCFDGPAGSLNIGLCQSGTATCVNGSWSECEGQILPEEEKCDGLDNNCNGIVDEIWPELGEVCGSGGLYMCKADGSGTECLGEDFCTPNPCDIPPESVCSGDFKVITYSSQGVCENLDDTYSCAYAEAVITDCEDGQYCLEGVCVPLLETCDDNIQNQDETDIDCGGSFCEPCWYDEKCLVDSDCDSDLTCKEPEMTCDLQS